MAEDPPRVVGFPFSRSGVGRSDAPVRDLGLTPLSRHVGGSGRSPKGHWCSRCQGVWWSYFLEAECPVCGNRHG
jgi:hypothetical protein